MHSVIRKQFFPDEGPPRYSGINMWRGVTRWKPFLDGATFVRVGWHKPAKVLIYPIRDNIDGEGRQLINWVCDIEQETPIAAARLEPAGQARGFHRRDRGLALPLARRAGDVPRRRPDPGISDGRPGPAAALVARPRHAARRRRASDAAARRQRRRAGDPRLHARWRDCLAAHRRSGRGAARPTKERRLPPTSQVVLTNREHAARRDPARGVEAHRRQAVPPHRRRDQPGRARRAAQPLSAHRRLRQGEAGGAR